ncbi:putative aminotransferase TAT2 [Dendrobium catenatum]|uniref:Putative aminotransferase TAT2 n=1 Tax=Dendrobium catenatum TaxID=906689 RepID=A0A2I0X9G0_9ASPA|nr:putative aminotransferase TAT2 [Dendrobium catenatum]
MVEDLADDNTIVMVFISAGNPCGNVLSYQNMCKVAESSKKFGIMVITNEVFDHLTFGKNLSMLMRVVGVVCPYSDSRIFTKKMIGAWLKIGLDSSNYSSF